MRQRSLHLHPCSHQHASGSETRVLVSLPLSLTFERVFFLDRVNLERTHGRAVPNRVERLVALHPTSGETNVTTAVWELRNPCIGPASSFSGCPQCAIRSMMFTFLEEGNLLFKNRDVSPILEPLSVAMCCRALPEQTAPSPHVPPPSPIPTVEADQLMVLNFKQLVHTS